PRLAITEKRYTRKCTGREECGDGRGGGCHGRGNHTGGVVCRRPWRKTAKQIGSSKWLNFGSDIYVAALSAIERVGRSRVPLPFIVAFGYRHHLRYPPWECPAFQFKCFRNNFVFLLMVRGSWSKRYKLSAGW
ncbi:unnamed protein product, partial [Pylaiella littoralis]